MAAAARPKPKKQLRQEGGDGAGASGRCLSVALIMDCASADEWQALRRLSEEVRRLCKEDGRKVAVLKKTAREAASMDSATTEWICVCKHAEDDRKYTITTSWRDIPRVVPADIIEVAMEIGVASGMRRCYVHSVASSGMADNSVDQSPLRMLIRDPLFFKEEHLYCYEHQSLNVKAAGHSNGEASKIIDFPGYKQLSDAKLAALRAESSITESCIYPECLVWLLDERHSYFSNSEEMILQGHNGHYRLWRDSKTKQMHLRTTALPTALDSFLFSAHATLLLRAAQSEHPQVAQVVALLSNRHTPEQQAGILEQLRRAAPAVKKRTEQLILELPRFYDWRDGVVAAIAEALTAPPVDVLTGEYLTIRRQVPVLYQVKYSLRRWAAAAKEAQKNDQ